ncbi:MAG: DoxX family protein [Cyanobacteria bacterium TGS_CYA1]|nr:DoxX family protein [Cyanobacteria bacterium TGS_CYA1]
MKRAQALFDKIAIYFMVALFIGVGVMHFIKTETFASAMPEYLPAKILLVQLTGVIEILGALGLIVEKTRKPAGICIALFLVCVFPVNLNMALNPELFPKIPVWALWLRLPIQGLLIWLALRSSRYRTGCQKPDKAADVLGNQ